MLNRIQLCIIALIIGTTSAGNLTISPSVKHQTIEGIGGALAMYSGWIPSHPNKEEIYDTLFSATGISLLRIGNWLQDTLGDIASDSEIVAQLRVRNPYAKVLVSSWTMPSYMKANNSTDGNTSPNSLKKVNGRFVYDQFAHWWKSSIRRYNASGIRPDYITLQNEINWNTDYWSALFDPTENDTIAAFAPALSAVYDSLATLPERPKILAPEVLGTGYNGVENYAPTLDTSKFYGWAFHFYGSGDFNNPPSFLSNPTASFYTLKNTIQHKPSFMTEYCNLGGSEALENVLAYPDTAKEWLNLAWIMQESFTELELNSFVFWDLAWGNTSSMVAVFPGWDRNSWPATSPRGFFVHRTLPALGQFSKFVRGGWVRIDATAADTALKVSAFLSPNSDSVTVVIVNPSYAAVDFTPMVNDGYTATGSVWMTTSTQALENTGTWSSGQTMMVPGRSVTTITGAYGISGPGATFYQFSNYGGLNTKLLIGTYTLAQLNAAGIPDNAVSSMRIDAGLTVELYDQDDFQSILGIYQQDVPDFSVVGIGGRLTSLKISEETTPTLEQERWNGIRVRMTNGGIIVEGMNFGVMELIDSKGHSYRLRIEKGKGALDGLPAGIYQARIQGVSVFKKSVVVY